MKTCRLCKGTQGAHFHWCIKVGGAGAQPRPAPPPEPSKPTQAEIDAEVIALLTAAPPSSAPTAAIPTEPAALTAHVDKIAEKSQAIQQELRDSLGMRGRQGRKQLPDKPRKRLQTDALPTPQPEPEYPRTEAIAIARLRDQTAEVENSEWRWSSGVAFPDWDAISDWDLQATALEMAQRCQDGLPPSVPYLIRDDVLALEGFTEEEADSALRHPERVTVRPETMEKGMHYPVLSFRRGDVNVILGVRQPSRPAIIALYWTSLLMGYDPTSHRDRTGGGGSKARGSIPRTSQALVKRLKGLGAYVKTEPDASTATVTYDGQDLGKINIGERVPKATVETDWQRTQRRIHAIDQRMSKVGAR